MNVISKDSGTLYCWDSGQVSWWSLWKVLSRMHPRVLGMLLIPWAQAFRADEATAAGA